MSDNLVSKKELLELTGITYGQLYRWKRKQLIPEEWFIKKSSFTGQETYFPKDKILERVSKILNLKEGKSLDELAETFAPTLSHMNLKWAQVQTHPLFRQDILDIYAELYEDPLSFSDLLGLLICQEQLSLGHITQSEGRQLIAFLKQQLAQLPEMPMQLNYLRKLGIGFFLLQESNALVLIEPDVKIVFSMPLQGPIEQLKTSFI